ncbi:Selenium-dependent xanthine dehydrogenase [Desulfovibrionales bacterium]
MIKLHINNRPFQFEGDPRTSLLTFLRLDLGLTAAKDGCSGQATCGACLVEVNGQAAMACSTQLGRLEGARVVTIEGFPEFLRRVLGRAFADKGAVQCGFCTPGFLTRTKTLLADNPNPTRAEVVHALRFHLCRCTGYVKIVDAILEAVVSLRCGGESNNIGISGEDTDTGPEVGVGMARPKRSAAARAIGAVPFLDDLGIRHDLALAEMVYGALRFTDHPRARIVAIDSSPAMAMPGVLAVLTATDVPGRRYTGMLVKDWPLYVAVGETTCYIGDVLACVVAKNEILARAAASAVRVEYQVLEALTDPVEAVTSSILVHPERPEGNNILSIKTIRRGEQPGGPILAIEDVLAASTHVAVGTFSTPAIEHGFLETECAVATPWISPAGPGVHLYSQGQGIYHDREDVAGLLGLSEEAVRVTLIDAGGAFGGKEDLSVQGHAALAAYNLGRPVKVRFSRPESLRCHPKRHAMQLEYALGCDAMGRFTGLRARILGDSGAYASLSAAVLARAATHATGAYHVPCVDVESMAVFTNNPPAGAMRGFGVNQVTFAMEGMVEELCVRGGFDPWQFRYDNALDTGRLTCAGQQLGKGIGLRKTLEAVREIYRAAPAAGLACAIKNCGIGNGIPEYCRVHLDVLPGGRLVLHHGWTDMGQGLHTVAVQLICEALAPILPLAVEVVTDTASDAPAGSTTASRGTFQLGHAVLVAADRLKADLKSTAGDLTSLAGRRYTGEYLAKDTAGDGEPGTFCNHISYSFATHCVVLDAAGCIEHVVAAHDAGRIVNPILFEGQVEGGVVMGLGYALSERLPLKDGRLMSNRLAACGLPRSTDVPVVTVVAVDSWDPEGPCGAKGVGEISSIPTAPAVANAFFRYDGQLRRDLPLVRPVADMISPSEI